MPLRLSLLFRYIFKEFLISFLISFLFFFSLFFVNNVLYFARILADKSVSIDNIFWLMIYTIPLIIFLASPFSTLLGALISLGRFSSNNEILAIQTLGFPLRKIFFPFFILALFISIASFLVNDILLPLGHIRFTQLFEKLLSSNPQLILSSNSIQYYKDSIIIFGEKENDQDYFMLLMDKNNKSYDRLILSSQVDIDSREGEGVVSVNMHSPLIVTVVPKKQFDYEYIQARKIQYNFLLRELNDLSIFTVTPTQMTSLDVFRGLKKLNQELSIQRDNRLKNLNYHQLNLNNAYFQHLRSSQVNNNVRAIQNNLSNSLEEYYIYQNQTINTDEYDWWLIEFYQKFSFPISAIAFVFLAFAIGVFNKRIGRSKVFFLGIIISLLYWVLWVVFRILGLSFNFISPLITIWVPVLLIFLAAFLLFYIKIHKS